MIVIHFFYCFYPFVLVVASDEMVTSLSFNLHLLGVGQELIPVLTEKEQTYWELLTPAEEELAGTEREK